MSRCVYVLLIYDYEYNAKAITIHGTMARAKEHAQQATEPFGATGKLTWVGTKNDCLATTDTPAIDYRIEREQVQ